MPDAVNTLILADGGQRATVYITNTSDGTGESAVVKVDVSALGGPPERVALRRITGCAVGMGVKFLFDATTDVLVYEAPANSPIDHVFDPPLRNYAGAGVTGDIVATTVGHTAGDSYAFELEVVKYNV